MAILQVCRKELRLMIIAIAGGRDRAKIRLLKVICTKQFDLMKHQIASLFNKKNSSSLLCNKLLSPLLKNISSRNNNHQSNVSTIAVALMIFCHFLLWSCVCFSNSKPIIAFSLIATFFPSPALTLHL